MDLAILPISDGQTTLCDSDPQPTYIVGIGASAGGLEALERLFEKMPLNTGLVFVVVQHLSPDFKSLTDELLGRRTAIPIHRVTDGMPVERNAIYLMPPKKDMIVSDGKLLLSDKDPSQMLTLPIDVFFRSLAQDAGDRAIAVILSGTGSDGSRGIRDIHEAGGLVLAQTPDSAKFDGMPKSAVQTGTVHYSLTPEEMPDALLRYIKHPLGKEAANDGPVETVPESAMEAIFRLLRNAYDIDFSHYKPETVIRRTERRLLLNRSLDLDEYVGRLARDPAELELLYKDLLIGVTRFFRDKDAFEQLSRDVLPQLIVNQRNAEDELRIWVAGCATGEEAYSLAILVHELAESLNKPVWAKIFATDVHRASLDTAGEGVYSEANLTEVSPERRERFFLRKGQSYQVTPELRKTVVFAQHNVIKDAPFTRLDLVSCRNLLIYFEPAVQKKVLSLFHFGLKTGGVLFLGPSESPGELSDEFDKIDHRWKLYRKRRDVRLATDVRLTSTLMPNRRLSTAGLPASTAASFDAQLFGVYDGLLDEFMPPSLLINERRELVHAFGGAGRYLHLHDGRFSSDILDMMSSQLRVALTGALQRTYKESRPVVYKGLRVPTLDGERVVKLTVRPVANRRANVQYALICLEELDKEPPIKEVPQEIDLRKASSEHLLSLESELRYTKENLQATIEELETSNEELQATNEELVAANEELQSTNEELHSVNEELYTVNGEYQKKIAELTEMTADLDNLLSSTRIHTMFLDHELRIRKFTPSIADTFNLLPQDVGRRIDSFAHSIDHPTLLDDIKHVLQSGEPFEKQVRDQAAHWFLLRILPYRSAATVDGVVLTLVDIGVLKQVEAAARVQQQQLALILRTSPTFVYIKNPQLVYVLADDCYQRSFGCDPVGKTAHDLYAKETADAIVAQEKQVLAEGITLESELTLSLADGPHTFLCVRFPLRDDAGQIIGVSGLQTDVTQLKRAEQNAREALVQRDHFLAMLSHELRNPLAAILNATLLIEKLGSIPGHILDWFRVIERRSRHMARLLDDLLDVARITQNKVDIRKRTFDLASVIHDVVEEVRPRFDERQQELSVSVPDGPLPVDGDPDRLQQIQVNLLLNAAKYTPEGGKIWYALARQGDEVVIRVRDTGRGIAPEMLDEVFGLFVQADDTLDRSHGGIGVGLTLVRSIVELHGGRVRAFSDGPDKGSEFIVWLPVSRQQLPAAASSEDKPAPRRHPKSRVLVVEDDADICGSLREILEMEGYKARMVADGHAALAAMEQERPDIALVDIGLPEMDGYEVCRLLRQHCGDTPFPVVALTGYGRDSDQQAARAAGFAAHLTKPVKLRELFQLLNELAAKK